MREAELDLPPEHCHYTDEGCDWFPSCLNCPFPRCRYDEPGANWPKAARDRQIQALRRRQGLGIEELAQRFGLSRRTIYRIIRREDDE